MTFFGFFWKFEYIFLYMMSQLLHESSKMNIFIIKVLNSYNHPMRIGTDCQLLLGHPDAQPAVV